MIKDLKICVRAIFGSISFTAIFCFCVAVMLFVIGFFIYSYYFDDCVKDCESLGENTSSCLNLCG